MSCPISKKALPKLRKRWPHYEVRFDSEGTSVAGVMGFPEDINPWT